jgi:adenosylmethionine-8-amino-7-oxononanoate aminotransferase
MRPNSLVELDRAHLIHPVASWRDHERRGATVLESGEGVYLTDSDGHRLIDAFAGLWCVNVGYGQRSIVEAAAEQMAKLPYATGYFHFGSEPAIRLAAELADLAPGDLNHVFFTLGGSDAVDTAIRLIRYHANVTGRPEKKHLIALDKGYHGSSSMGSGMTGLPAFHRNFDVPLAFQHHIPAVYPYRDANGGDPAAMIAASVQALKAKVDELGPENVAAFFCEPVLGSAGVIVPPRGWLAAMREACRELGILFVADEVITGFGRTGPLFGCEYDDVVPDLMTLAKGLTAGYCPMGGVMLSDGFYEAIRDGTEEGVPVGHGLTYSAHPVSAAVGREVLRLYTEGGLLENGRAVGGRFERRLAQLADHPLVGDVRSRGLLAAVELVTDKATKTKPAAALRVGERMLQTAYRNGLIIRGFADGTAGFAPPLCCTDEEIELIVARFEKTLDDLMDIKEIRDAVG